MFTFWDDKPGMTKTLWKDHIVALGILIQLASLYGSVTQTESACGTMYLFCVHILPWSDIMASGRSWIVYVV